MNVTVEASPAATPRILTHSLSFSLPSPPSTSSSSSPTFALHVTQLDGSLMLWVGVRDPMTEKVMSKKVADDWACAVPPPPTSRTSAMGATATTISRTGPQSNSVAESIARRLSQRFKHQIFLSLDLPSSIVSDSSGSNLLLVSLEKELVKQLTSILNR